MSILWANGSDVRIECFLTAASPRFEVEFFYTTCWRHASCQCYSWLTSVPYSFKLRWRRSDVPSFAEAWRGFVVENSDSQSTLHDSFVVPVPSSAVITTYREQKRPAESVIELDFLFLVAFWTLKGSAFLCKEWCIYGSGCMDLHGTTKLENSSSDDNILPC